MRKTTKIVLAVVLAISIIAVISSVIILDSLNVSNPQNVSNTTNIQTFAPTGTSVGNALVLYEPDDNGTTTNMAGNVAADLQTKNYTVTLATMDSSAANRTMGYSVIVLGAPFYNGSFSNLTQQEMHWLVGNHDYLTKSGIYIVQDTITSDDWMKINFYLPNRSDVFFSKAVKIQLTPDDLLSIKAQQFVDQIIG
jgi:hypothetical protein